MLISHLYPGEELHGPYLRPDKRKHLIRVFSDGRRTSLSYPKYLMEKHLGRRLTDDETVDHINRDCTDDRIENLQVLTKSEHAKKDAIRLVPQNVECQVCKKKFQLSGMRLHWWLTNKSRGPKYRNRKGPFCSKSCAGIASHDIGKYLTLEVRKQYYRR